MKLLIFIFICLRFDYGLSDNPEVNTTSGVVIGATLPQTHAFYGIRYGEAPTGELRFKEPQRAEFNEEKQNLSEPTYIRCYEPTLNCDSEDECSETYTEDCLFLDINVPSSVNLNSSESDLLPVMFWIHGGAFSYGSGTELKSDGRHLANVTNTVMVSINYRLDALGCLVFEENGERFKGNQGIKDQQLALQWVHDNIEKFGGDKTKITIFGVSAGGQSVVMHLMSPTSRPLFRYAIIESYRAAINYQNIEESKKRTEALLEVLECSEDKLQCLMNTTAYSIMKAHPEVVKKQNQTFFDIRQPYRPILDGVEFTKAPLEFFQSPPLDMDQKIIIGTTADEAASIKEEYKNKDLSEEEFIEQNIYYAGSYYGPLAAKEYMKYADSDVSNYDYTDLLAQEVTDMMFTCPNRALARLLVDSLGSTKSPIYSYVFDYFVKAENCEDILIGGDSIQCKYASHASELWYVFNSGSVTGLELTEEATTVADFMNELWGNFAYSGTPTDDANVWETYLKENQWSSLNITGPESSQMKNYRSEFCDFWDDLGFYVNLTSPTAAPEETTTSGNSPLSSNLSLELLLSVLVWFRLLF